MWYLCLFLLLQPAWTAPEPSSEGKDITLLVHGQDDRDPQKLVVSVDSVSDLVLKIKQHVNVEEEFTLSFYDTEFNKWVALESVAHLRERAEVRLNFKNAEPLGLFGRIWYLIKTTVWFVLMSLWWAFDLMGFGAAVIMIKGTNDIEEKTEKAMNSVWDRAMKTIWHKRAPKIEDKKFTSTLLQPAPKTSSNSIAHKLFGNMFVDIFSGIVLTLAFLPFFLVAYAATGLLFCFIQAAPIVLVLLLAIGVAFVAAPLSIKGILFFFIWRIIELFALTVIYHKASTTKPSSLKML